MNKLLLLIVLLGTSACSSPKIEANTACQAEAHVVLLDTAAPGITTYLLNKQEEVKYKACMKAKSF